jgi:2-dehydro-3-deoxyphosphooctonate aldolase (KDO 8-P synthase)
VSWSERVRIRDKLVVSNESALTLFAGANVVESETLILEVAEALKSACTSLNLPWVFKASWDKANRSSVHSFRGLGLERGLAALTAVREQYDVPILTDIHSIEHVDQVARVADIIQIPAFLCRQTDLLRAACETGRPLLVKKMQMMAPSDMRNILEKCSRFGCTEIIVCERGTSFGYSNLVVDPLAFPQLKALRAPVAFDVTHALQRPGGDGTSTGGRGHLTEPLTFAGVSQGLAALFLECHPDPPSALCDGPCAFPLHRVRDLLERVVSLDRLVKSWDRADTCSGADDDAP